MIMVSYHSKSVETASTLCLNLPFAVLMAIASEKMPLITPYPETLQWGATHTWATHRSDKFLAL